jgi:hypothetical protein
MKCAICGIGRVVAVLVGSRAEPTMPNVVVPMCWTCIRDCDQPVGALVAVKGGQG